MENKMNMKIKIKKAIGLGLVLAMLLVLVAPPLQVAEAGLTGVSATLSRLAAGVTANHTIDFTMVTPATAGQTIIIQWDPVGHTFDLATLALADITFTGATLVTACGAGGDEVTVAIVTGTAADTATFTVCLGDTVAAGAKSIVFGNEIITNPAAGSYDITVGGTMADSGIAVVHIVTDDRVIITADVLGHLTFAISDTTIGFGTLDPTASKWAHSTNAGSSVAVSAHNFTVSTNAVAGYVVTIAGTTLTIPMTAVNITAIGSTAVAPAPGAEQFGIRITHSGGIGTASAPYNVINQYAFDPVAQATVASAIGPSDTTIFSVYYMANIAPLTEAGAYSTVLIYIATGTF